MTLLSKNVSAMKSKIGILIDEQQRTESVFFKENLKMAINRNLTVKKNAEVTPLDNYARGTVLVNNVNAAVHRGGPASVRTIVSGAAAKGTINIANHHNNNNNNNNSELLRCKRKIHFISGQSYPGTQPASVARRNARERNRVKQVNNGFATLRSHIPASVAAALSSEKSSPRNSSASKKLSKVETLKMAVEYIRSLQQMLEDHNNTLEKKVAALDQQMSYDKQFDMDDNYYSSSPETSTVGGDSTTQSYPGDSPCRVYPKIEPSDSDCYAQRQYAKSEPDDSYIQKGDIHYQTKSENFNHKLHETLTSEFYGARSPVKTYYLNQEEGMPCSDSTVISDKLDYSLNGDIPTEVDRQNGSPNLTVLTSVSANQVVQYSGSSFLQAHCHRNPASLSPPGSEACPSPTPSYASDHSSVHMGSVVSGSSSGHLISSMSRLTTHAVHPDAHYKTQLTSPIGRSVSPKGQLTPPRTLSPISSVGGPKYMVPVPSSPSNQSGYSVNMEFQKGSPEGYDNYEAVSPEDEELLDVISWWQQSH